MTGREDGRKAEKKRRPKRKNGTGRKETNGTMRPEKKETGCGGPKNTASAPPPPEKPSGGHYNKVYVRGFSEPRFRCAG